MPDDPHLVAVLELLEGELEVPPAEVAERAEDVGPDVDAHVTRVSRAPRRGRTGVRLGSGSPAPRRVPTRFRDVRATASTAGRTTYRVSGIATRVRTVSTALYRRYRPETFTDVIGQEHVTEPLMQALRTGRVNHAYLFSGPRGCGKTTSARILARCLNCEQGPTPDPCGTCDSCVALARGGSGHGRRHRDRRRQPRRCRRRPRPARARVLRAGPEPLQGLHHRRGAHGDAAGLQRAAEDRRGAARAREVRLRDDRAREGHRHHPLAHPPLPVPAGAARPAAGLHGGALRQGGRGRRAGRAVLRRARRRRVGARLALGARPAHRGVGPRGAHLRGGRRAARVHRRRAARRRHRRLRRR